jgi:hypothetical protein
MGAYNLKTPSEQKTYTPPLTPMDLPRKCSED